MAQLESLGMMVAGAIWIVVVIRRYGGVARPEVAGATQPAV